MSLGKPTSDWAAEDVFMFPASFAQQRLWFVEQLSPGSSLYTLPLVFRLKGQLHSTALEHSVQALVTRHESLRTTFEVVRGDLMQMIAPDLRLSLDPVDLCILPLAEREQAALTQIRQAVQQPFDLRRGPLLRVRLWWLADDEYLLLLLLHHIVFDEWSSGVLIRELGELYAAFAAHQPIELAELPIQYADFAHWQRQWLQGDVLQQQLSYWRQQLKGLSPLNLAEALGRSPVQRHQGGSQLLELPQSLLEALESLSQQAGTTLFMTLLAAFQTLLYRYSGQADIALGSPIANRHRSELEGLIGFLVNSLVLRSHLTPDLSFRQLLEQVREMTLAAYAHQDVPFEKLVEELQPVRSLSQNPLFQVVFALQNAPMEQLTLPGLTLQPVEFETQTTRFDLELYLWKCAGNFRSLWGTGWQQTDGLRGLVVYNTDLFDQAQIAGLRRHFQVLLEGMVADPDRPLGQLPLLTEAEQQQLAGWNQTQREYPANIPIHRLFEQQVRRSPDAIALRFGPQLFTYQALNQGSNQLARYLQTLGVGPGQRVGICLDRTADAVAAMLASLKTGAAYVPLDPSQPAERLQLILQDADIAVVLTRRPWAAALERQRERQSARIVCLEEAWGAIAAEADNNVSTCITADQLAYVMYTSGSTGTPKGVMVPHHAVNRLVCNSDYVRIERCDRIAQVANLAFDAATFEVWGALLNGAELVGLDRPVTLSPPEFAAELQRQQISILFLTTALFNQTVSQVPNAFQPLKYLLFGGEAANPDRVRQVVQQGKPQHLVHVYGPTENTTFSTAYEVREVPAQATTIPIGRPIANTQAYVLDAALNPLPVGLCGDLYLGGDGLALGYLNQPQLTAERFITGPASGSAAHLNAGQRLYKTGDRARYLPNGALEFLGRQDAQVKIRGFRVELGEIETVLAQHPAVQTAVVTVREVAGNSQLIAYVVPAAASNGPGESLPATLREYLQAKLPDYMLPAAFMPLAALPLTPNGKVDQRALPAPLLATGSAADPTAAPKTLLEQSLADLWRQLLGCDAVGIHDNFFDLGGHSLLATQLVSRIRDQLQVEIPLRAVFETPTIAGLVERLDAIRQAEQTAITRSLSASSLNQDWKHPKPPQREEIEL